jgi:hypothetical protein
MSATRDPDRLLRAWLDLMPDEAPDRAIAAVLQAVETTRQARVLPRIGPWRLPMNRLSLIAAVTVIVAALIGGTYILVGNNSARPALPTAAPTGTPVPTAATVAAFDEALWGLWVADAEPIAGLPQQGARIQLAVNWDGGVSLNVQTDYANGTEALGSDSLAASPGQFRLRAQSSTGGCQQGDIGTYTWVRSTDGLFLTLAAVNEACALRSTTLARTWVHSLGGVNDGGPGMALMTDPYPDMQVTLPKLTWGMGALPPVDIGAFGAGDPDRHFTIFLNPRGFADGCATTGRGEFQIDKTTEALRTYIAGLPATNVKADPTTIGGLTASHISGDTVAKPCAAGDAALFYEPAFPTSNGGPGEITFAFGEHLSLWAVVVDGDLLVLAYTGVGVTTADEQAIMDTISFTNGLPTP